MTTLHEGTGVASGNLAPPSAEELWVSAGIVDVVEKAIDYCKETRPVEGTPPWQGTESENMAYYPHNTQMYVQRMPGGITETGVRFEGPYEGTVLEQDRGGDKRIGNPDITGGFTGVIKREEPGQPPVYTIIFHPGINRRAGETEPAKRQVEYSTSPGQPVTRALGMPNGRMSDGVRLEPGAQMTNAELRVDVVDAFVDTRLGVVHTPRRQRATTAMGVAVVDAQAGRRKWPFNNR